MIARCCTLIYLTAEKYGIPAVYITAHIRSRTADAARFEVWNIMIDDFGLRRQQVADLFGRDRRRVRANLLRMKIYFRVIGDQYVWNFAIPLVIEVPPAKRLKKFMREVPLPLLRLADENDRQLILWFYEAQAAAVRKLLARQREPRIVPES